MNQNEKEELHRLHNLIEEKAGKQNLARYNQLRAKSEWEDFQEDSREAEKLLKEAGEIAERRMMERFPN